MFKFYNTKRLLLLALTFFCINNALAQGCTEPSELLVNGVGMHHARISWTSVQEVAVNEYEWQVTVNGETQVRQSGSATASTILLTNLVADTGYTLTVRSHCSEDLFSEWLVLNFSTKNETSVAEGQIGTGADANPVFDGTYGPMLYPLVPQRNGTVVNMLFTQPEMTATGITAGASIIGVAFEKLNGTFGGDDYPDLRMRLFAKNSDFAAPLSMETTFGDIIEGHTEVSDNPAFDLPATIGWINFPFDNAFQYSGEGLEFATAMYQNGQTAQFSSYIIWQYTANTADKIVAAWPINTVPMDENLMLNHNNMSYKKRPNMKIFYEVSNVATGIEIGIQDNMAAEITQNGGTLQLLATIAPLNINQEKTWNIVLGAEFATITESGLLTATGNGTVIVEATSADDASITDTIEINITGQVLGNSNFDRKTISVYPNPAKTIVNIGSKEVRKVKVVNLTGQLLLEATGNNINLTSLSQGQYILDTEMNDGKHFYNRIIKE